MAAGVRYQVEGWGTGEVWLEEDVLLLHELPSGTITSDPLSENDLTARFRSYFAGERPDFSDVRLDLEGYTPFHVAVVETLRRVPYGEVVTYGELAALAGRPNAPRAAGSACAQNRFPLVVPCHRVVSATGIGGYGASGVEVKRRLLGLEGVSL